MTNLRYPVQKAKAAVSITYLSDVVRSFTVTRVTDHKPSEQGTMVYGNKIGTPYKVSISGEKPLRVWAICWSNAASFYVIRNGQKLFLHGYDFQDC